MPKISFSEIIGIAGIVLAVVLVVLDKASKLKGHWLFILLGIAAVMTLFIAVGNSWVIDAPERWRIWRGALLFCITAFTYSGIALWITPVKLKPPDNRRDNLTISDQVKVTVTPAPAIKAEVYRAPPKAPEEPSPAEPKPRKEIAQQPIVAHIRIASQQTVVSTNPGLPYGLEVIVQTDQAIQPVAFVFECDGEIGEGRGGLVSGGVYSLASIGIIKDHPN